MFRSRTSPWSLCQALTIIAFLPSQSIAIQCIYVVLNRWSNMLHRYLLRTTDYHVPILKFRQLISVTTMAIPSVTIWKLLGNVIEWCFQCKFAENSSRNHVCLATMRPSGYFFESSLILHTLIAMKKYQNDFLEKINEFSNVISFPIAIILTIFGAVCVQ